MASCFVREFRDQRKILPAKRRRTTSITATLSLRLLIRESRGCYHGFAFRNSINAFTFGVRSFFEGNQCIEFWLVAEPVAQDRHKESELDIGFTNSLRQ